MKKLKAGNAVKASILMQKLLGEGDGMQPSMVETLWVMFNDPQTESKTRLNIANFFARQSLIREQVAKVSGLGKFEGEQKDAKTIVNITIEELKLLPQDARDAVEKVYLRNLGVQADLLLPEKTDVS